MIAQLPLAGLVGLERAHTALRLLAVAPQLGGVVIGAPVGSGKSAVARAGRILFGATTPFIELPLGSDEEALLGGIDIEATLRSGQRTARAGLLARADHGLLYADAINLLPEAVVNVLLGALDTGMVHLEREGMSQLVQCRLRLIGTYDPAEGLPRRHLLDRIGLMVLLPSLSDGEQRRHVLQQHLNPDLAHWHELDVLEASLIHEAQHLLPEVVCSDAQQRQLIELAVRAGVQGHRVDVFASAAARAAAALDLRGSVSHEDLQCAAELVILPRATRDISQPDAPPPEPPPPPPPPPAAEHTDDQPSDSSQSEPEQMDLAEEEVLAALECALPLDLADLPFRSIRRGRTGSRGAVAGKRGRHIRSTPGNPRRARIDIPATLRAAAPWQPIRAQGRMPARAVSLRVDDIRVKQYRSKAGVLFCFVVDASGSMALNRMRQAKGAVQHLLQQAYVHRDRVALLAFRGVSSELLLPPSQSVELARRALDVLPTGGTTPLGSALLATIEVAAQARSRGIMQCVAIFLTDGRGNVAVQRESDVKSEIEMLARAVARAGVKAIVVDTQRSYLSRGEGRVLAEWLEGAYIYLPQATGSDIAHAAVHAV